MNETEKLLNTIMETLYALKVIEKKTFRALSVYFKISHTTLYNFIKTNRINIKMFKFIKRDENLVHIYISDTYIIDNILLGLE